MRLTLLIFVLSLLGAVAEAAPIDTTIKECWEGNDHRGLNRCVTKRAAIARTNLQAMEDSVRKAIAKSNEDASYLKPVQQRFEASVESYRKYRKDQCQLREALAAMGNGAGEIKLACEAELDTNRAEELKAGIWWLK